MKIYLQLMKIRIPGVPEGHQKGSTTQNWGHHLTAMYQEAGNIDLGGKNVI